MRGKSASAEVGASCQDLQKGAKLVKCFFAGQLHTSHLSLSTQAGRQTFDCQFLRTSLLGELLTSDKASHTLLGPGITVYLTDP